MAFGSQLVQPGADSSPAEKPAPGALLAVRDLAVGLRTDAGAEVPAVAGVSFEVAAGETVGILGESGCGKTTTALALLRLLPTGGEITGGSVEFGGRDLLGASERELQKVRGAEISIVFQEPAIALHPTIRAGDQVAEVIRAHRGGRFSRCRREAASVLAQVFPRGSTRIFDAYPHQLSGGQRQRVVIAQALACRPALLIADEPTASLDATTQAKILGLIGQLRKRLGMALILISHNPAILAGLADRLLVMYAGRIVEQGKLEQVYRRPLHPYTRALLRLIPQRTAATGNSKPQLPAIPGSPPDPGNLPSGCAFEPRCAERLAACAERAPEETEPENARRVRCFLYGG